MEQVIKIEGGHQLEGEVTISGAKNATVALIPAAVLANGPVTIVGIPQIADVNNGNRFETYTIAGEPGSGMICLNGAAARQVQVGDHVIIMCYCQMSPEEVKEHKPKVVFVDDENKIVKVSSYEKYGTLTQEAAK